MGWLPLFSHGRGDLVDEALARLEVAGGECGDDGDELLHRVATDGQRVGVRVTRAGERGEVRLGQALDQCRVHDDALGDDVGLLTRGVTTSDVVRGRKGLDVLGRDTEHDSSIRVGDVPSIKVTHITVYVNGMIRLFAKVLCYTLDVNGLKKLI